MRKIIYTKYANERSRNFSVRTDIAEEKDGVRVLCKKACYSEGKDHIEHIFQSYGRLKQELKGSDIFVNKCEKTEEGIELEFVKGQTLQEILDGMLRTKNKKKFTDMLTQYLNFVQSLGKVPFRATDEFRQIFGNKLPSEGLLCAEVTDIDMILSNILVDSQGKKTLIDYEWTFDFPIPVKFVIYRILHYYEHSSELRSQIAADNWYDLMKISDEDKALFLHMEKKFQEYVLGEYVPMRSLRETISLGYINIPYALGKNQFLNYEKLQIFYSADGIIREEDSGFYLMQEGRLRKRIPVKKHCKVIRLDPGERCGALRIRELTWNNGILCQFKTNGVFMGDGWYFFRQDDPQIIIEEIPEGISHLLLSIEKMVVDSRIFAGMSVFYERDFQEKTKDLEKQYAEKFAQQQAVIESQKQELELMKSTKVWRLYRKYKALGRGD